MLGDRSLAFVCMVPWCESLETLPVLEPEQVSENVLWTRFAASLTMLRAASLSEQLVDRRMSCSSSLSRSLTSRLQRLPLFAIFFCRARSFYCRNFSCICSRFDIGLSASVDPLPAETGTNEECGEATKDVGVGSSANRMAC